MDYIKILVPSDGSEHSKHVIRHAIQFARHFRVSEVIVLYVLDTSDIEEFKRVDTTRLKEEGYPHPEIFETKNIEAALNKQAKKTLTHLKEEIESTPEISEGVKIKFSMREGEHSEEIVEKAEDLEADMIIMGSLRLGGRFAIRSVAAQVVRTSKIPIMIVGLNSKFSDFKKILVPVDMSDRAELPVKVAACIARRVESDIKILHVVNESAVRYFSSITWFDDDAKDELIAEYIAAAEKHLEEISDLTAGLPVKKIVKTGAPVDMILKEAEKDCQLIVMYTRGKGHIGRALIGSVTGGVINQAKVPVLLVKEKVWVEY